MLNNVKDPEFLKTPEMFDILLKFSMINNFGANYSMKNLEDESFLDLQYLQICISAQNKFQEMQNKRAQYVSRENVY